MVTTYLLDTNVISEAARQHPDPSVVDQIERNATACALPATAWHELRFGVERLPEGRRRHVIASYVASLPARFPILPYDAKAADWHARHRARAERRGRTVPFADGQIAATAVANGLVLVTRNLGDFAGIEDLSVESWH